MYFAKNGALVHRHPILFNWQEFPHGVYPAVSLKNCTVQTNFGPPRVPVTVPTGFGMDFLPGHEYLYWRDYFAYHKEQAAGEAAKAQAADGAAAGTGDNSMGDTSMADADQSKHRKWAGTRVLRRDT